jgi:putative DNA primase/helicase
MFVDVLTSLLGDYAATADFNSFIEKKSDAAPRNDLARLNGARMVRSSEVGEGKRFDEALIKTLTGSEKISARFLYSEAFEFEPTFKLWFSANHKPVIRGTDYGIWRRVRLVPFNVTIPLEARRPYEAVLRELCDEHAGILAWAVRGCLEWRHAGLQPPDSVLAATAAYRADSDVLGAFLEDSCELNPAFEVSATDLYAAYSRWAKEGGEYAMTLTAFGRRLEERGIVGIRRGGSKYRKGLKLQNGVRSAQTDLY